MLPYLVAILACLATSEALTLPESSQIALEAGRTLLPYQPLVEKIEFEVNSIRANYKAVSAIKHQQAWIPGELLGDTLTPEQINRLNSSAYGPVEVVPFADFASRIYFTQPYNPVVLSRILESEYGIRTNPNEAIGRSQTINYNVYRKEYTFYQGSGDCGFGCTDRYYWVFREYPDGYIRLVRQSATSPPIRPDKKYETKPFSYAPTNEEASLDDGKKYAAYGTGILAAKYKFQ